MSQESYSPKDFALAVADKPPAVRIAPHSDMEVFMVRLLIAVFFFALLGLLLVSGHLLNRPDHGFRSGTDLDWPETARVLSYGNSYGGLCGDGEKHLVFETDDTTIARWLAGPPPWHAERWERGPVPEEIGRHCDYRGASAPLDSHEVWYVARARESFEQNPYRQRDLVVIDPLSKRVWWFNWKD
jgi:hypothetical protein